MLRWMRRGWKRRYREIQFWCKKVIYEFIWNHVVIRVKVRYQKCGAIQDQTLDEFFIHSRPKKTIKSFIGRWQKKEKEFVKRDFDIYFDEKINCWEWKVIALHYIFYCCWKHSMIKLQIKLRVISVNFKYLWHG